MQSLKRLVGQKLAHIQQPPPPINNHYLTSAPSPQNAVDILKGEWSSRFPPPLGNLTGGPSALFEDDRLQWFASEIGSLQGRHVLELGPLEGGHSYMLERQGAESITAVEGNTHAYLKCLISKELLGMQRVKFLCGDFIEYLKDPECPKFDIGVASGVLYHMVNPVEMIGLLAKSCRTHILIWTHYYDKAWADAHKLESKFPYTQPSTYDGFSHTLVRQQYGNEPLSWIHFCGGSRPYSYWMYREEIIKCLEYFGFPKVKIGPDQPDHPNGPAFTFLASRA
jgi:hypothetical protein